eukprot:g5757.t1
MADQPLGYYSDWSVYAEHAEPSAGLSYMSSAWKVPAKPQKSGPAGLSAVYFFNGLEDGGGKHGNASLILQPVLSHGRSGCVVNPLAWGDWHMGAFLVDGSGRAHCGKAIKVSEGDTVVGNMTLTDSATNTWSVTAGSSSSSTVSKYTAALGSSVKINAAYLTLEGMVIYNCQSYPAGGGTEFTANVLKDGSGASVQPRWTPMVRHSECGQGVQVGSGDGAVMLKYDSTK